MAAFNRFITSLFWFILLLLSVYIAIFPAAALAQAQVGLDNLGETLESLQAQGFPNFLVGQILAALAGVLFFGLLLYLELRPERPRGVRIRSAEGGTAEIDVVSISQRLEWHLDQLSEIISVTPTVRSRGHSVDIKLDMEAGPNIDVPMKTDEVVEVTREILEENMGLKLGKLDVQMRCAPFEPEWNE